MGKAHDNYPTPPWVVHRFLDHWPIEPGSYVLEPCAGDGQLIRAVKSWGLDLSWVACELRGECEAKLDAMLVAGELGAYMIGDFLKQEPPANRFDYVITNPPFSLSLGFVEHALRFANNVAMLLPITWQQAKSRNAFLRANAPHIRVIPERITFVFGDVASTDFKGHAWYVWTRSRPVGSWAMLCDTPQDVRRAAKDLLR